MIAHCWFCDEDKEMRDQVSATRLGYGCPAPSLQLILKGSFTSDGERVQGICKECRSAILHTIAESKIASIENVLKGA